MLWPRAGFLVTWSCGALVFCYLGFFTPRKGTRQGGRLHEPQGTRLPGHKEQQGTRGRDQAARTPAYQPSRVPGQLPGTRVLGGKGPEGRTRAPFCKRHGTTRVLRDQGPRDPQGLFTGIQAAGGTGSLPQATPVMSPRLRQSRGRATPCANLQSISGLVVDYIVAIDVTRVRFPADAFLQFISLICCCLMAVDFNSH